MTQCSFNDASKTIKYLKYKQLFSYDLLTINLYTIYVFLMNENRILSLFKLKTNDIPVH